MISDLCVTDHMMLNGEFHFKDIFPFPKFSVKVNAVLKACS